MVDGGQGAPPHARKTPSGRAASGLPRAPASLRNSGIWGSERNFAHAASSMSNSPQTRLSSVGSRNTVAPLDPYRARLSATFVPNTSRNRSTFSTVVVARIMTVLLMSGLLRILLLAGRFGRRRGSFSGRRAARALGRPGVAPSRCRLPSAGSDREGDPGQLFGDCPQAALDGGVVGLPAGVGQCRVAPGAEQPAGAVVLAAGHAGVGGGAQDGQGAHRRVLADQCVAERGDRGRVAGQLGGGQA